MGRFLGEEYQGSCRFCDFMHWGGERKKINTPWISNDEYFAFVSAGSLLSGWTLVFPKEHKSNLSSEYRRNEFWLFVQDVVDAVTTVYGEVVVFEHGALDSCSKTGCGVDHAHFHIVPMGFSLAEKSIEFNDRYEWERCSVQEVSQKRKDGEYLFVADHFASSSTSGYFCKLEEESSQFFRKVIADALGKPEDYDYKEFRDESVAERSFDLLSEYMSINSTVFESA